jgi:hypothetical protein
MTKKTLCAGLVSAALSLVLGLTLAPAAQGQITRPPRDFSHVPNVYGPGEPFVFSGLDGPTSWQEPMIGHALADGLGIRLDLPKSPTIRIRPPAPGLSALKWQMATNDTWVATVPWDAEPMIVIFADRNHVVGRLPLSFRVNLEGGDTNAILLQTEREGRTHFSFCYDPTPTPPPPPGKKVVYESPVMRGAQDGYKVSVEGVLDGRLDLFRAMPVPPENVDKYWNPTVPKAFAVLRANENSPEGTIPGRWASPARGAIRDLWLADAAFSALGLMHMDAKYAKEALTAVYAYQKEDGMIPGRIAQAGAGEVSGPPILGWAAWQVYAQDKMQDREFLEKSFDAVQKHVTWYMKKRRMDGEPPPTKSLEWGTPLYAWASAEEAGTEGSPRFKDGAAFAAVDLSCYLANECYALQMMAQRLGFGELAKTWGLRGDAIADAARRELWNSEQGFFFDRKGPGGEWLETWSYAGLLPMWAGVATPDQAARLKNHLLSKKFWTAAPVPTLATDDKAFKNSLWSGAVSLNVNYLVIRGLQRCGYAHEASEIREKTLDMVAENYRKTGVLWECYDPEGANSAAEVRRTSPAGGATSIADYNWTAALFVDMILRPKP